MPVIARTVLRRGVALAIVGSFLHAVAARAADGAFEIAAACVAQGCFPGDAPGFPVTTAVGKRYVLTSDLSLTNADGVALAENATLDLNGFAIHGSTLCSGTPVTVCSDTGATPDGVVAAQGSSVGNGRIHALGGIGVRVDGPGVHLDHLLLERNKGGGIYASNYGTVVTNCRAIRNGGNGLNLSVSSQMQSSVAYGNQNDGISVTTGTVVENTAAKNGAFGFRTNGSVTSRNSATDNGNGSNGSQMATDANLAVLPSRCGSQACP